MKTRRIPAAWLIKRQRDPQYAAAAHVFDFLERCWTYTDGLGVWKGDLLDAAARCSHGEYILVRVALDLYDPGCVAGNGHKPASLGDITAVLDATFYDVFEEAMRIMRAG